MRERKDVYKLPADDKTLEWYSKAVAEMKTRPTNDPTSWAYQGAIHGLSRNPERNQYWIPYAPVRSAATKDFWEQCQHQTWYFIPWHRMYLAYFEQIVASVVAELGGPADWSLPFWNYSDTSNPRALDIPTAFTTPADSSNPLWMPNRRNTLQRSSVALTNLAIPIFTSTTTVNGFGGTDTNGPNHGGGVSGGLESLPHNRVHMDIGGAMGDPDTAGLDPIFYLHHANIDRLWQVWINEGGRLNPSEAQWKNYKFNFHDKDKQAVTITSADVEDTANVLSGYVYQGVPNLAPTPPTESVNESISASAMPLQIAGATDAAHKLMGSTSNVSLKIASARPSLKSRVGMLKESVSRPARTRIHFENVKGKGVAPIHSVYINVPDEGGEMRSYMAGTIAFFGLEGASNVSEHSAGSGLTEVVDVTDLVAELRSNPNWDESNLNVEIRPIHAMDDDVEVSVGKISLYTE